MDKQNRSVFPRRILQFAASLFPCSSVESSVMEAIVLTGEQNINDDLCTSYIIIAFLGNPPCTRQARVIVCLGITVQSS
jgi:hypothetical protein